MVPLIILYRSLKSNPLPVLPVVITFNLPDTLLPITDDLTNRVISLPIHTEMDMEQLTYITEAVLNFINK